MSKRRTMMLWAFLLFLYIGSYLWLSRRGFDEARAWNAKGFYFFSPQDSDTWRYANQTCVYLYSPLIVVDEQLGTGMSPASEPMWGLSK